MTANIITTHWSQWAEEQRDQERAAPLREADERRWARMRERIDDLGHALRGRQILLEDLQEAIQAIGDGREWQKSNAALRRIEEAARLLRMTDQALVELERTGSAGHVRQFLHFYLSAAHFRVIDAEYPDDSPSVQWRRYQERAATADDASHQMALEVP